MWCTIQETLLRYTHIYAFADSFVLKKLIFVKFKLIFNLKNKLVQTKIIPSSKSTFKIKVTLERAVFLILLTLAVNI